MVVNTERIREDFDNRGISVTSLDEKDDIVEVVTDAESVELGQVPEPFEWVSTESYNFELATKVLNIFEAKIDNLPQKYRPPEIVETYDGWFKCLSDSGDKAVYFPKDTCNIDKGEFCIEVESYVAVSEDDISEFIQERIFRMKAEAVFVVNPKNVMGEVYGQR